MNNNSPFSASGWIWLILMMYLFSGPIGSTPMYGVDRTEESDKPEEPGEETEHEADKA